MPVTDFDFLLGDWTIHHRRLKRRLAGDDSWEEFGGFSTVRESFGGMGNFDESIVEIPSGTYAGTTIRLFNPKTAAWSITWIDSRTPAFDVPMVGHFEGGIGRFYCSDSFEGRPIRVRFLWSRTDGDSPRWEQAFSQDGAETWETNWVMDFSRAKTPAPAESYLLEGAR